MCLEFSDASFMWYSSREFGNSVHVCVCVFVCICVCVRACTVELLSSFALFHWNVEILSSLLNVLHVVITLMTILHPLSKTALQLLQLVFSVSVHSYTHTCAHAQYLYLKSLLNRPNTLTQQDLLICHLIYLELTLQLKKRNF